MEISFLTQDLVIPRHNLLQACLRPGFDDYGIEHEYPIVLNPEHRQLSICVYESPAVGSDRKALLAHANYWPRILSQPGAKQKAALGLVGNVATAPSHRGQGIMKQLFDFLWCQAQQQGLEALVLWSDLVAFYHKLGFEACGQEQRFYFAADRLLALQVKDFEVEACRGSALADKQLARLLELRYPTQAFLERTVEEFRILLRIPDTTLLLLRRDRVVVGYGIVGKGFDLIGMVHEWGAQSSSGLLALLRHVCVSTGVPELGLLAPDDLQGVWLDAFAPFLVRREQHAMALVKEKPGSQARRLLEAGFLWGLDSI